MFIQVYSINWHKSINWTELIASLDNLNGSKLHEHDSGIDSSSYSSSINTKTTDKEGPLTPDRTMAMSGKEKYEAKKSIFILIGIFSVSLAAMFYVYMMFPQLEEWVQTNLQFKILVEFIKTAQNKEQIAI